MATLASVLTEIRELSFDRFVSPTFLIEGDLGFSITVTTDKLLIKDASGNTSTELLFSDYPTMDVLVGALITTGKYKIAYLASFIGSEPSNSLLPVVDVQINPGISITRRYFYSDSYLTDEVKRYYQIVLNATCDDVVLQQPALGENVATLKCTRPEHMALWVAIMVVDKRRLYELAGEFWANSTFSGSGVENTAGGSSAGVSIEMQVGDVFRVTKDPSADYNKGEEPWRIGADNVLGDAQSFWYKLYLWLRDKLENLFGDYSFRKDNVLQGNIILEKDSNWYAFFDSYPYTISPLTRSVLTSGNWNALASPA